MTAERRSLNRVLRVRDGLAVVVGSLIGMGILRTPGIIAGYLGNAWLILAIWIVGGIVAALSAALFAELAAAYPKAGGKYVYAAEAFGPVAGFVAGWSELGVAKAFSGAAKAVVIAEYVVLLTGRGSVRTIAIVTIFIFAAINLAGLRAGTLFQNVTTFVKASILACIAVIGLWAGYRRGFASTEAFTPQTDLLLGFAVSYQLIAYTYYGWDDAGKMAEEMKDPGRSLPRMLLGGYAIVTVLYLVIIVAFMSALTPAEMAKTPFVAQAATAGVFGASAGAIMTAAGIFIIMSTLNTNFLVMPRVAFALARAGMAPSMFTRVSTHGTPVPALLFATAMILALTATGAFEMLIRYYMLVCIAVDLMVFIGFLRLRRLQPNLHRPFRVPLYPWLPIATVALYVLIVVIIVWTQPQVALGSGTIALTLLVAGLITARRNRRTVAVDLAAEPRPAPSRPAGD